jgi:hypothetical protein
MKADATEPRTVAVYIDYKSPYAYLAKDLVYELERDFPVRIDWLPYRLDIPSFLGSARLDDNGRIIEEQRNAHQWRRVRYVANRGERGIRQRRYWEHSVPRRSGLRRSPGLHAFQPSHARSGGTPGGLAVLLVSAVRRRGLYPAAWIGGRGEPQETGERR